MVGPENQVYCKGPFLCELNINRFFLNTTQCAKLGFFSLAQGTMGLNNLM